MTEAVSSALVQSTGGFAASATPAASSSKTISQDDFLKLFVAQLQHQDPLSPLEPNDLTAQLAQFSSLEQLTGINTRLDTLTGVSQQTNDGALIGLLGRRVSFDGSHVTLASGKASAVEFTLDRPATAVTATVRAADGTTVRVVELGAQAAGKQSFTFDGRNAEGVALPDGTYGIEINALAQGDKTPTSVSLLATGTVDGIDLVSDPHVLLVGGVRVPLDQVREVHTID
jgi:flagellar basal-body rod modification protein FlgD